MKNNIVLLLLISCICALPLEAMDKKPSTFNCTENKNIKKKPLPNLKKFFNLTPINPTKIEVPKPTIIAPAAPLTPFITKKTTTQKKEIEFPINPAFVFCGFEQSNCEQPTFHETTPSETIDLELKHDTPVRFNNIGNSCWLNASLSCLLYNQQIRRFLEYLIEKDTKIESDTLLANFLTVAKKVWSKIGTSRIQNISKLKKEFFTNSNAQQDATEAIFHLLDTLRNTKPPFLPPSLPPFLFKIKYTQTCNICGKKSIRPLINDTHLQLETKEKSLEEGLKSPKTMISKNCPICKKETKHSCVETIDQFPNVFILALPRAEFNGEKTLRKNVQMQIPITHNFGQYGTKEQVIPYRITSFITHRAPCGEKASSGHFICYTSTYNPKNQKTSWWKCNDSEVKEVEEQTILGLLQPSESTKSAKTSSKNITSTEDIFSFMEQGIERNNTEIPFVLVYTRIMPEELSHQALCFNYYKKLVQTTNPLVKQPSHLSFDQYKTGRQFKNAKLLHDITINCTASKK